jgi:CRISPR-associated protein Csx14
MSPQVITETLYALHMEGRMVDGIRILTTRQGKREINAALLNPEDGHYYRFCRDYGIDPDTIDFQPKHVIAVRGEHGMELDDIATDEENEAFLKACMEAAFELAADPARAVYFSVAGGRKTMGSCLTVAAQCYGRPQDRIYHVLVNPEFESNRDFFYPPPEPRLIELKDPNNRKETIFKSTEYARITLVPMPFISLRASLSDAMLNGPESPQALMLSLVRDPLPELVINLPDRKIVWKGMELDMRPSWLALYAYFALVKKDAGCDGRSCQGCRDCFTRFDRRFDEIEKARERIAGLYLKTDENRESDAVTKNGVMGLDVENFTQYRSKINSALVQRFGTGEATLLAIESCERNPSRYGIPLDRERIRVVM